jgi:flagellar basal-body rod modification protein FlgD
MSSSINSLAALTPPTPSPSSAALIASGAAAATGANLDSENVFLQLLVAQLKNQDPEQPTDGTAFVTELAQFTTLQTDTQSTTDLNTIVAALPGLTPTTPAAPAGTTNTTNP